MPLKPCLKHEADIDESYINCHRQDVLYSLCSGRGFFEGVHNGNISSKWANPVRLRGSRTVFDKFEWNGGAGGMTGVWHRGTTRSARGARPWSGGLVDTATSEPGNTQVAVTRPVDRSDCIYAKGAGELGPKLLKRGKMDKLEARTRYILGTYPGSGR